MIYACQRYYFGAMAEHYFDNKLKEASVNVRRNTKTLDGFNRLPEVFASDDVMRCFGLSTVSAAYMRLNRLMKDHLIEKDMSYKQKGTNKVFYRKTDILMT